MKKHISQKGTLRRSTHQQLWIGVVLAVIIIAVLEYAGLLIWLRSGINRVVQPVRVQAVRFVNILRRPADLALVATRKYTYILDLELRYAEQAAQLGELEQLRRENQELRAVLEKESTESSNATRDRRYGSIVSYAPPSISLGAADGAQLGELVFILGTCIGKLQAVEQHHAQVKLLSNFSEDDVLLGQTDTGVSGLVRGDRTRVLLSEIPIEASLQVGQRVETVGQLGVRGGIYIGRVAEIIRHEGAPTQSAVIEQGVSFFSATVVEVRL